jgi:hypothetical protein
LHPDHIISSMEMGYMFEELIRKFAEISKWKPLESILHPRLSNWWLISHSER